MSADIVAADQLKAIVQRVERLEAEIADLNADKSEIYKEARANGFDVKVIKKVVSKRKIDEHERVEQDHVFDIYWDAVHGLNLVHAHARENIEEFDAETGEILDNNQASVSSHAAPSSLTTREAEESVVSNSPATATMSLASGPCDAVSERTAWEAAGSASGLPTNSELLGGFPVAAAETNAEETGGVDADKIEYPKPRLEKETIAALHSDQPLIGGDHEVASSALRAGLADPTSNTGEGAANTALPDKPKHRLRPNCLDRSNCKSGSTDHCWSCKKAMAEKSEVAA